MKKALITCAALALLVSGCDDKESRANGGKSSPTFMFWCFRKEIVSSEYHVPEMATPAAAAYLQNVVRTLPGYDNSSSNLEDRTITISYQSSVVRKMNFEEAIALAGFAVNGRPADPAAAAKIQEGLK